MQAAFSDMKITECMWKAHDIRRQHYIRMYILDYQKKYIQKL